MILILVQHGNNQGTTHVRLHPLKTPYNYVVPIVSTVEKKYHKILYKVHQIPQFKWFSSCLAGVFSQSMEAMC